MTLVIGNSNRMYCLAIHENKIYSGGFGIIRIWDTYEYTKLATLEGHTGDVICLATHENKMYSGSEDNTIRIWNI